VWSGAGDLRLRPVRDGATTIRRRKLLCRKRRRGDGDSQKPVDHGIDLVGDDVLMEVAGAHGLASPHLQTQFLDARDVSRVAAHAATAVITVAGYPISRKSKSGTSALDHVERHWSALEQAAYSDLLVTQNLIGT
jgi:hypothetical protein